MLLTGGTPPDPPQHAVDRRGRGEAFAIGVGLVLFGVHRYRQPPRPRKPPAWTARIDDASLGTTAAPAWLLQPWAPGGSAAPPRPPTPTSPPSSSTGLALTAYRLLATLSLLVMEL
ncbi:hypothetical protein ACU686_22335 [Yinghuangia aomiensis]